ncbi:outer membrane protein [Helicobacter cetorum]|uniref:outer membrane protein n=1 Tax=Helicobacter cetorum TaxID=138563 RepID=UPI000CF017D7|nr:outer membrane protein [Helicobacter cetorum]
MKITSILSRVFLIGSLLTYQNLMAEDNGWYMSVGYQIGGTQQEIDNKALTQNINAINQVRENAITMAGSNGLMTLTSRALLGALNHSLSNSYNNQLQGIAKILNTRLQDNNQSFSVQQMQALEQEIMGLSGSANFLKAHSVKPAVDIFNSTNKAFQNALKTSIDALNNVNKINPSSNNTQVKAELQNTITSLNKLLNTANIDITNAIQTTYANTLLTQLQEQVNQSNDSALQTAFKNLLITYGLSSITKDKNGVIDYIANNNSNSLLSAIKGNSATIDNSNNSTYNNTLTMNIIDSSEQQALNSLISPLQTLAKNAKTQGLAQKFLNLVEGTLNSNAINETTLALNNLYNALRFRALGSVVSKNSEQIISNMLGNVVKPSIFTNENDMLGQIGSGANIIQATSTPATAPTASTATIKSSTNPNELSPAQRMANTQRVALKNNEQYVPTFNIIEQVLKVYNTLNSSKDAIQAISSQGKTLACLFNDTNICNASSSITTATLNNPQNTNNPTTITLDSVLNGVLSGLSNSISSMSQAISKVNTQEIAQMLFGSQGNVNIGAPQSGLYNSYDCNTANGAMACSKQMAVFYKLINTLNQGAIPTSITDMHNSTQYKDPTAYYQGLQNALGYSNKNGTITLTQNGVLQNIFSQLQNQARKIDTLYNTIFSNAINNGQTLDLKDSYTCKNGTCTIKSGSVASKLQELQKEEIAYNEALNNIKNTLASTSKTKATMIATKPESNSAFIEAINKEVTKLQSALNAKGGTDYLNNQGVVKGLLDVFNNLNLGTLNKEQDFKNSTISSSSYTYNESQETHPTFSSDSSIAKTLESKQECVGGNGICHALIAIGNQTLNIAYNGDLQISYTADSNKKVELGTFGNYHNFSLGNTIIQAPNDKTSNGFSALKIPEGTSASIHINVDGTTLTYNVANENGKMVVTPPSSQTTIAVNGGHVATIANPNPIATKASEVGVLALGIEMSHNYDSRGIATSPAKQIVCGFDNPNEVFKDKCSFAEGKQYLAQLLNAIPTTGATNTNEIISLFGQLVSDLSGRNQYTPEQEVVMQEFFNIINNGMQDLGKATNLDNLGTLLQKISNNTESVQVFNQKLDELLGHGIDNGVQALQKRIASYQDEINNIQALANNYGREPFLNQYAPGKSHQHGVSNGFGINVGYKQFFGNQRIFGFRYYGFFDYGYTSMGIGSEASSANIFVYGAGTDFLWDVFRRTYYTKAINFGFFAGVQVAGATWASSLHKEIVDNWGNSKDIDPTHFQFLFNLGVRTNFSEFKKYTGKMRNRALLHQQGIEFGIKIPTINQAYLNSAGADVKYRRLYTFYINYVTGF